MLIMCGKVISAVTFVSGIIAFFGTMGWENGLKRPRARMAGRRQAGASRRLACVRPAVAFCDKAKRPFVLPTVDLYTCGSYTRPYYDMGPSLFPRRHSVEFDRTLHDSQLAEIADLAFHPDSGEIRGTAFEPIDWTTGPDSIRINTFRILGIFEYRRADESHSPMWVWYRPCKECTGPIFALTKPWDFRCSWLHAYMCPDCRTGLPASGAAEKRAERFESMRERARTRRENDSGRQQAVLAALAHFEASGRRVSRAPQSPDYFIRLALETRALRMAPRTARDVMERLIALGKIEEFGQRYNNGGPIKHSIRLVSAYKHIVSD